MTQVNVIAFPGAPNLPVFAAQKLGFFDDAGITLRFETTPSSVYQFEQFGAGNFDIAFTAFDNVVAYREGQGAVTFDPSPDFRAILGATQVELSVIVAPDVTTADDLRGRSIALDAVGTGFAFVLYDMLERMGLPRDGYEVVPVGATPERWQSVKNGDHAATIAIEPFTSIAEAAGFRVLARSTDMFATYQGGVIATRKDWVDANETTISNFLAVYRRGLAWVLDPANRDEASSILAERMPDIRPAVLSAVMSSLLDPRSGLTPDGAVLWDGVNAVLDLRSKYGRAGRLLSEPATYFDLRWAK